MPQHKGPKRKTRSLLTSKGKKGLSRLMTNYEVGQKVVVDIEPSQPKGMPHRRFQGRVGIVKEIRKRSLLLSLMVGQKEKNPIVRLEHVRPLRS
jgi:large subunit ribosomal protein L21e